MIEMKRKAWAVLALFLIFLFQLPVSAAEIDAYDFLLTARKATHAAGPFCLSGQETVEKGGVEIEYAISGYDYMAYETHIEFTSDAGTEAYLITPETIYAREGAAEWKAQEPIALLPLFARLGVLDQFFMLELLNGERLAIYQDYISFGKDITTEVAAFKTVELKLNREQYVALVETLTSDIKNLLGVMADRMSEFQLRLLQNFAKGMLSSLDAEMSFQFQINSETDLIERITSGSDMADPFGEVEEDARMKTEAAIRLTDFGKEITRIEP
jgi:hypothetical protein